MVTKTKEYQVLDIEDVEKAVSEAAGRKVTIGEMDVTLIDGVPMDSLFEHDTDEFYMACEIRVNGETVYKGDGNEDDEIIDDEVDLDDYAWPLDGLLPDGEAFVDEKYIFNFSPSLFKSYNREVATDD